MVICLMAAMGTEAVSPACLHIEAYHPIRNGINCAPTRERMAAHKRPESAKAGSPLDIRGFPPVFPMKAGARSRPRGKEPPDDTIKPEPGIHPRFRLSIRSILLFRRFLRSFLFLLVLDPGNPYRAAQAGGGIETRHHAEHHGHREAHNGCLLYTSDAADD